MTMRTLPTRLSIIALLTMFALVAAAQTQFLYKYLGSDGKTTYSNTAPPPGVKFEKIPVDTAKSGVNLLPSGSTQKSANEDFEAAFRARKAREAERDDAITLLQEAYDRAVANLEAEKEAREGERSQNTNGTSRLNETYFNRIADLQKAVDDAKEKLDAAKRQ